MGVNVCILCDLMDCVDLSPTILLSGVVMLSSSCRYTSVVESFCANSKGIYSNERAVCSGFTLTAAEEKDGSRLENFGRHESYSSPLFKGSLFKDFTETHLTYSTVGLSTNAYISVT